MSLHDSHSHIPVLSAAPWQCIDLLSDVHLHAGPTGASTLQAFSHHLAHTPADAVFVLGDLFEVWVGDDAATPGSFEADIATQLHGLSQRAALYFMAGNRDFLLGDAYLAQAGMHRLHDPTCLDLGDSRWLLTHGDAWCLDDLDYQRFRQQVRTPAWQAQLLAKSLTERQAIGRAMREASANKQADMVTHADVDSATAQAAMAACGASVVLHGHTHRPAVHTLPARQSQTQGQTQPLRIVLSDWELDAQRPRADVIRLRRSPDGAGAASPSWQWERLNLHTHPSLFGFGKA